MKIGDSALDQYLELSNYWDRCMGSQKRKLERSKLKQKKKKLQKELKQKAMFFNKLQDSCEICNKSFDKKSKEHALSWSVIVKEEEQLVKLYCPECWTRVKERVQQLNERSEQ